MASSQHQQLIASCGGGWGCRVRGAGTRAGGGCADACGEHHRATVVKRRLKGWSWSPLQGQAAGESLAMEQCEVKAAGSLDHTRAESDGQGGNRIWGAL